MNSPQMFVRAVVFAALALGVEAQEQASFTFYHGSAGKSQVKVDNRNQQNNNVATKFTLVLPVGGEVCVSIPNAHPAMYSYSLIAKVDTPKVESPDISQFAGLLNGLATGFKVAALDENAKKALGTFGTKGLLVAVTFPEEFTALSSALKTLSQDVDSAKKWAADSDSPEPFSGDPGANGTGYAGAVAKIAKLSNEKHRFNDTKLRENLSTLSASARAAMKKEQIALSAELMSSMEGFLDLLVTTRDGLKADYGKATVPRPCKQIVSGRNTIRLHISKKQASAQRDTTGGDGKEPQYATLEVISRYERKIVSVDPMTVLVNTWKIPQFQVVADTLVGPKENVSAARAGLMLSINPTSWDVGDDWGLGFGLGLGLSASDAVTDYFAGVLVSYRSNIRFGVGFGRSKQPKSVKGATIGKPLPANFGKLEDAIEQSELKNARDAVYFLVSIPGLALKKK